MTSPQFPWTRPRSIGLDGGTIAKVRAYEADHSLPGEPYDIEPAADLRPRLYALSHLLPQILACDLDEDGPDIDCLTCEDSGFFSAGAFSVQMPCPDCARGDWTWGHELLDDMRNEP